MLAFVVLMLTIRTQAQLSFSSAISLALEENPRIKAAENDVQRAQAALSVSKDIYIPSLMSAGGVGYSHGITLTVPTIFTVSAQSLVYSSSQRSYIHGAQFDLEASRQALIDAREQVEEDVATTYVSLNEAQQTAADLREQYNFAMKIVAIVQDRMRAGVASELDEKRSRRQAVQLQLDKQHAEDDLASVQEHLSLLTGFPGSNLTAVLETIPSPTPVDSLTAIFMAQAVDSPTVLSAEANLQAKQQRAIGDSRSLWRPQVSFSAEYGRVSPINNVSQFYNLNNDYNVAFAGVQIQVPLLDKVRRAAARESLADARASANRVEALRDEQMESRRKLRRSIAELATKLQLAELDEGIARDELKAISIQANSMTGGRPLTPEDEQNAHIRERQKYRDLLDAQNNALRLEISLRRQTGQLDPWLRSLIYDVPATSGPRASFHEP